MDRQPGLYVIDSLEFSEFSSELVWVLGAANFYIAIVARLLFHIKVQN